MSIMTSKVTKYKQLVFTNEDADDLVGVVEGFLRMIEDSERGCTDGYWFGRSDIEIMPYKLKIIQFAKRLDDSL